jgi:hypothetical protein
MRGATDGRERRWRRLRRTLLPLAVLSACTWCADRAVATPLRAPAPEKTLTVKALSIIGRNDTSEMDARIPATVQQMLRRLFPFKGYRLSASDSAQAALRQAARFSLPAGLMLTVKPLRVEGQGESRRIELAVDLLKGDERIGGATVLLRPDRYWALGGPPVDGGTLIVVVAVLE